MYCRRCNRPVITSSMALKKITSEDVILVLEIHTDCNVYCMDCLLLKAEETIKAALGE